MGGAEIELRTIMQRPSDVARNLQTLLQRRTSYTHSTAQQQLNKIRDTARATQIRISDSTVVQNVTNYKIKNR